MGEWWVLRGERAGATLLGLRVALCGALALSACTDHHDATDEVDAGAPDAGAPIVVVTPDAGPGPLPMCGPDERRTRLVYYGTAMPTAMPLTPGQVLAVVDFDGCSGTFISDEWVLTAQHCGVRVGARLCVGPEPANANVCFTSAQVENHSAVDLSLVRVDAPASSRIPELAPIPVMTELIDGSWVGRTAEAAGYGTQEDGSIGEREFTAEPIAEVDATTLTINGMGVRGVCFGDSGGPVMVLASDSTVRVVGALSGGDSSCVGLDTFARADAQLEWIEAIVGPVVVDGAPCGRITEVGDCMGLSSAVWCDTDSGLVTSEVCGAGTTCGWDVASEAYRCVEDDPCGGVSAAGACQGTSAVWCDAGVVRRRNCGECGELCRFVSDVGGFYCRPNPCIGIAVEGECAGNVLTVCDPDFGIQREDCALRGRVCGWSDRRSAYRCVRG